MLRLWREFVFPAFGAPWAVSYQDEKLHTGNLYRFDGWRVLATSQRSGPDTRSGRAGRSKSVWGWNRDPDVLRSYARPAAEIKPAGKVRKTGNPGNPPGMAA